MITTREEAHEFFNDLWDRYPDSRVDPPSIVVRLRDEGCARCFGMMRDNRVIFTANYIQSRLAEMEPSMTGAGEYEEAIAAQEAMEAAKP